MLEAEAKGRPAFCCLRCLISLGPVSHMLIIQVSSGSYQNIFLFLDIDPLCPRTQHLHRHVIQTCWSMLSSKALGAHRPDTFHLQEPPSRRRTVRNGQLNLQTLVLKAPRKTLSERLLCPGRGPKKVGRWTRPSF